MIHLSGITHDRVGEVWAGVLPYIELAIEGHEDEWTPDYVHEQVTGKDWQLWVGHENRELVFVGLTELNVFPATSKVACVILLLGGSRLDEWEEQCLAEIESWAIDVGADDLVIKGRPGWVRKMKKHGFGVHHVTLSKPLGEKQ